MTATGRIIKKYSNRRLYDTEESCYIKRDRLKDLVVAGVDFRVVDADSEDDLTRQTLLSIILDEEDKRPTPPLFSEASLRNIIKFYGGPMQASLCAFLDQCMPMLARVHKDMAEKGGMPPQMGGKLWNDVASMQANIMSGLFENYIGNGMNVYTNIHRQLTEGAEQMQRQTEQMQEQFKKGAEQMQRQLTMGTDQMFKLPDFGFPFGNPVTSKPPSPAAPKPKAAKKTRKKK